ncbi:MAG: hypothetical protein ACP5L1_07360 [Caldivirga sp.]
MYTFIDLLKEHAETRRRILGSIKDYLNKIKAAVHSLDPKC